MLERLALVESKDKSGSKGLTESLIVTASYPHICFNSGTGRALKLSPKYHLCGRADLMRHWGHVEMDSLQRETGQGEPSTPW